MRILALSSWWPEPADNGIKLRLRHLLQALASRHELHLLALAQGPHEQPAASLPYCASAAYLPAPALSLGPGTQLASLIFAAPASVRATWSPAFAGLVQQRAASIRPEVMLAFELSTAPYARLVAHIPRVVDDLEMARLYDNFALLGGRQRLRAWLTWAKHRSYVRRTLRDFSAATVVSEREATLVRALAPTGFNVLVLPNGADVAPLGQVVAAEPDTLIYPGALSYAANLDAMQFFLGAILPQIRAARPQTRLRITGRVSAEQRQALPQLEGVELTGFVPDIRQLIAASWAEVVPLREGSGTRLKILEALALGTPVISTSKGAEGLELERGRHLLIADQPASFSAATLLLLSQPALRARMGDEGRRAVVARYDWQALGGRLEALVADASLQRRAYAA